MFGTGCTAAFCAFLLWDVFFHKLLKMFVNFAFVGSQEFSAWAAFNLNTAREPDSAIRTWARNVRNKQDSVKDLHIVVLNDWTLRLVQQVV